MKRLWAALLILALLCPAGSLAAVFSATDQHEGTAAYSRAFLYVAQADELVTLALERALFKGNRGPALLAAVRADVAETASFLGEGARPCEIFVVQKLDGSTPICTGSRIYCTLEQAQAGAYRDLLPRAMTGCADWQLQGFYAYRAGEQADTAALAGYYEAAEDLDQLSLSPVWFNDKLASAEEIARSQTTRTALSAYLIERDGAAAFLQTAYGDAARTAWLHAIGVERDYADAYPGVEEHFEFLENERHIQIQSKDWRLTFYIVPFHTPARLRRFLYHAYTGTRQMLETVQAQAPAYYERFSAGLLTGTDISVYYDREAASITQGRIVHMVNNPSYFHELLHVLVPFPTYANYAPGWAYEGLSDSFTAALGVDGTLADEFIRQVLRYLLDNPDAGLRASQDYDSIWKAAAQYFDAHGGVERVTWYELSRFCAYKETTLGVGTRQYERYPALMRKEGNELYENQGVMLADYMISRYGLEAFLHYLYDQPLSFEACFGVEYEQVKSDFLAELVQYFEEGNP